MRSQWLVPMFRCMGVVGGLVASAASQDWHFLEPPVRLRTAMVFGAARGRTVEFGGWYAYSSALAPVSLDDTWGFDGHRWRRDVTTNSPSPRTSHAMAYDSVRRRTVLFGGVSSVVPNTPALADTWEFDGFVWTQITTAAAPPVRLTHGMTFDVARGRTVLFGGYGTGAATHLNDTWEYDGVNWTQVATASSPSARGGHAMTHDVVRGRTVLFGGVRPIVHFADTWEYDGSNWTMVATAASPSSRGYAAMTFDSVLGPQIQSCPLVPGAAVSNILRATVRD